MTIWNLDFEVYGVHDFYLCMILCMYSRIYTISAGYTVYSISLNIFIICLSNVMSTSIAYSNVF